MEITSDIMHFIDSDYISLYCFLLLFQYLIITQNDRFFAQYKQIDITYLAALLFYLRVPEVSVWICLKETIAQMDIRIIIKSFAFWWEKMYIAFQPFNFVNRKL